LRKTTSLHQSQERHSSSKYDPKKSSTSKFLLEAQAFPTALIAENMDFSIVAAMVYSAPGKTRQGLLDMESIDF